MSKITYQSVSDSEQTVRKHPQIIRELVSHYRKLNNALAALTSAPAEYAKFYQDAGLGVPTPASVLQALIKAFAGSGSGVSSQQAEANEALRYDVRVATVNKEVVHLRKDRKTEEVEVLPADLLTRQCAKYEVTRPGFTTFLGDLVTVYDFTQDRMQQWSTQTTFVTVKPVFYDFYQLEVFGLSCGDELYCPPVKDATPKSVISALVDRVGAMDIKAYLELSTKFYDIVFQWEFNNPKLLADAPIRQVGTAVIEGVPFFRHHSTAGVDKARAKYYLYRAGPWGITSEPPQTTRAAVTNLGNSRAHRREDQGGYSGYTAGHMDGGDLPGMRIDVTRILSLTLPFLEEGKEVEIRSTNVEVVKHLATEYAELKLAPLVRYVMSEEAAINTFGADLFRKATVPTRTLGTLFVDMVSTEIPSMPSKSDAEEIWEKHFLLPAPPFIAYRKVPPHMVEKCNVFKMGSSHAFDFIVSSYDEVECRGKVASLEHGKVVLTDDVFTLPPVKTKKDALVIQFIDDRRKLELFTNVREKVKYSSAINLWSPPPFFNKKAQHRIIQTVMIGTESLPIVSFTFADDVPPGPDGGNAPVQAVAAPQQQPPVPAPGGVALVDFG